MGDDIQYLLHLEATKRYVDDARNIKRQVDEHVRAWQAAKVEYLNLYSRLATVLKHAGLRHALDAKLTLDDNQVEDCTQDIAAMSTNLSSNTNVVRLDVQNLSNCKMQLEASHKPRDLLGKEQCDFGENQKAFKDIAKKLENVQSALEAAIPQAIDKLTTEIQPPPSKPH